MRSDPVASVAANSEVQSRYTSWCFALMMFLAPAIGFPGEEVLQDTLKSIVVSLITATAGLVFFWFQRREHSLLWHSLMWLPLAMAAYAFGSMAWSHTYLAGVEAARWLVFALILFLGMNIHVNDIEKRVLLGVHWGICVASVWTALQFWMDFKYFPQGPNPASTFINRNFFAEYAVCALPYSVYLLLGSRDSRRSLIMSAYVGFNVVAICMTGTRSALIALLVGGLVLPVILIRCRLQWRTPPWGLRKSATVGAIFLGTVLALGTPATGNPKLLLEFGPQGAIERAVDRTLSIAKPQEYATGSFSVRSALWRATGRMIEDRPITGVGAGAWEVYLPLYQDEGTQLEIDFYAHNEVLQLIAEYGLVGALFLLCLFGYLIIAAWKTWSAPAVGSPGTELEFAL